MEVMGGQLSLLAQTAPSIGIFSYIDILDETHYVSQLNNSRFLKTCKALDPNGEIVVKVFIKPKEDSSLEKIIQRLKREAVLLSALPNVLNYSKIFESTRCGYLVRQHLKTNLYDRLSTRPYFTEIETKFVVFQLLQALKDIHDLDVIHGDIKTENLLLTSWDWVVLSDFCSNIKPAYIPDDNPGEFSFYFDTSKRRACYLAPEKFDSAKASGDGVHQATKEMDIFSLGCCIAELYLDGAALFNLSQLFKYKSGDYTLNDILPQTISKSSPVLKDMLQDMLQVDPKKRLSAHELLEKYRTIYFPDTFYDFLYDYCKTLVTLGTSVPCADQIEVNTTLQDHLGSIDEILIKIYCDFGRICKSLKLPVLDQEDMNYNTKDSFLRVSDKLLRLENYETDKITASIQNEVSLIILVFLCKEFRNLQFPENKVKALQLILAFSLFVLDDTKLDRTLPYLVAALEDDSTRVKVMAMNCVTTLIKEVKHPNQLNENIFVDYLLPRVQALLQNGQEESLVRVAIASNLSDLALKANLFQEYCHTMQSSTIPNIVQDFESIEVIRKYSRKLQQLFEDLTVSILTDPEISVKVALLKNILPLCKYFGREKTNDVILSHLITYLNDRDPALRMYLVECISGIAILLGPITMEQYILPLIIQTITDEEELVVVSVLKNLKDLLKTRFVNKKYFYDITKFLSPLILHPNSWIRNFVLTTLVECINQMSKAEVYCVLYPVLRPFFDFDVDFTGDMLISCAKLPVSRNTYNLLRSWNNRSKKTFFWQRVTTNYVDAFGNSTINFVDKRYVKENYGLKTMKVESNIHLHTNENENIPLTLEDKFWIDKFKNSGLTDNELWKIVALREYVVRSSRSSSKKPETVTSIVSKLSLTPSNFSIENVMPNTVFFDIEFLHPETLTFNDLDVTNTNSIKESESNTFTDNHSKVIEMKGSLIFKTPRIPTTLSNLKNIYVQLEPTNNHSEGHAHLSARNQPANFIVKSSYEGQDKIIEKYLKQLNILPFLKEYKEFGFVSENTTAEADVINLHGKFVRSYPQIFDGTLLQSEVLLGTKSFMIYGSDQGALTVWDIDRLANEKSITRPLYYECSAEITCIKGLSGYDSFCVGLKSSVILIFRISLSKNGTAKNLQELICIRSLNLIGENSSEYPIQIECCPNNDQFQLVVLSNYSNVYLFDIRTMKVIEKLELNADYGCTISMVLDDKNNLLFFGTVSGIIEMWDARYFVQIRAWTFGESLPINKLAIMEQENKSLLVVCGGVDSAFFTLWNIEKLSCKHVFVRSNEQPSLDSFNVIDADKLDKLAFEKNNSNIKPIVQIFNNKVLYMDDIGRLLHILDTRNPEKSSTFAGSKVELHSFSVLQVTASLTMSLQKHNYQKEVNNSNYTSSRVMTVNVFQLKNKPYMLLTDEEGYINIYT